MILGENFNDTSENNEYAINEGHNSHSKDHTFIKLHKRDLFGYFIEIECSIDAWFRLKCKMSKMPEIDLMELDKQLASPFQNYNP